MVVLGVSGGADRVDQTVFRQVFHDASATVVRDGEVIAAVEEERFNRYKHSGKLPAESIRYCLRAAGVELDDIDACVFALVEDNVNASLESAYRARRIRDLRRCRPFLQDLLTREIGRRIDPRKFAFIDHHFAHALSAFLPSGFTESLVVTLDGIGNALSGTVWIGRDQELAHLRDYRGTTSDADPISQSLGHFYLLITVLLGFEEFDEYKVMGLAPYGDPARFRGVMQQCYMLKTGGDYQLDLSGFDRLRDLVPRRGKSEPIEQVHMDLAASLQETLETVVMHVLQFYEQQTKARYLCLAGGVAHNCAMTGKILRAGLFEQVFVQPAAHDGGLSLGAALYGHANGNGRRVSSKKRPAMPHVYLGPRCDENVATDCELARWSACLEYERVECVAEHAAQCLAQGLIVGWVQGRSEFGPRALGNRSILADPRPADNKDIINAMVKKREAFRPFAPAVLEEYADQYFELPPCQKRFPYMTAAVKVRQEYQAVLGAVTHVDGTARIQTVSRESNERFWHLIDAFGRETGIPIVLNTSFNNNAEPIVNVTREAVVCFLTSGLNLLVIGDYIVRKKAVPRHLYWSFRPSLPPYVNVHQLRLGGSGDVRRTPDPHAPLFQHLFAQVRPHDDDTEYCLGNTHDQRKIAISAGAASLLAESDGYRSLEALSAAMGEPEKARLLDEMLDLWAKRVVVLEPAA